MSKDNFGVNIYKNVHVLYYNISIWGFLWGRRGDFARGKASNESVEL